MNNAKTFSGFFRLILLALAALLFLAGPASASNDNKVNYVMGVPPVTNLPGTTSSQAPHIDGKIAEDWGWTGAYRFSYNSGALKKPDVIMQAIRDAQFLYLSFEVLEATFDEYDLIALAFDPDNNPDQTGNHRLIHIYPVDTNTGAKKVPEVQYYKDSSLWKKIPADGLTPAPWLDNNISVFSQPGGAGNDPCYYVEMRIPITNSAADPNGINLPPTGDFGFYWDVWHTNDPKADEKTWPENLELEGRVIQNTPDPNLWGTGKCGGKGKGVSFSPSDIYNNTNPNLTINLQSPNTFHVDIHNDTVDGSGIPIAANQVRATFKIADFGLNNNSRIAAWNKVPAPLNPTAPDDIAASAVKTFSTGSWTPDPTKPNQDYANRTHQCILVELDSSSGQTIFVNRSAWQNMDFVNNPPEFQGVAKIGTRGLGKPPFGQATHTIDLKVSTKREAVHRGTGRITSEREYQSLAKRLKAMSPAEFKGSNINLQIDSRLIWIAHGFLETGKFVIIKGKRFRIQQDLGAFGYVINHLGLVEKWEPQLTGGIKISDNLYRFAVKPESAVQLKTRIVPEEVRRPIPMIVPKAGRPIPSIPRR